MLKRIIPTACAALMGAAMPAQAADMAPTAAKPMTKAASSPAVTNTATKPSGAAPVAGDGGSVSTNGSNTGTQVAPKKPPKCPDPTVACPAEKVISQ